MSKTLADLSAKIRDIDFCMLITHGRNGAITARPMRNNREVDYNGDSFFFAHDTAEMIGEIAQDPQVGLTFQSTSGLFGQRPFFTAVEGRAELIRDRGQFESHWTTGLDRRFPQGTETPDLVLIKVQGDRMYYWDGEDEGRIELAQAVA